MAAPCPLLGDGITDDTLLHIVRFLPTAKDLLSLCLTCPRFRHQGHPRAARARHRRGGCSGGSAGLSLVEEAPGRLWVAGLTATASTARTSGSASPAGTARQEGMQSADPGDRISMLLDLDQGPG